MPALPSDSFVSAEAPSDSHNLFFLWFGQNIFFLGRGTFVRFTLPTCWFEEKAKQKQMIRKLGATLTMVIAHEV
ncbi:hypothetical protein M513_03650 [Trichuris suis]|uniref:Uncharacterized protein n=1 Tax=Trichuris suis TaxID=68888 RepID=A0A085MEF2_9BILA|nr:hypothetical protein M513_03650 [Trichuris suis]